jgi:hypothetical protein|tara:strand:- start:374 stop:619 length:246 start_codon:yes stop_codon:yes gene_type:complete
MTKRIHEDEYMSSDIWKYNLDPPEYKRGSRHNRIGMWIMWIFYGIITVQLLHAFTVIPFFPITFTILLGLLFIVYVAWRAS